MLNFLMLQNIEVRGLGAGAVEWLADREGLAER